jgi:prophage antirepressor-like protein
MPAPFALRDWYYKGQIVRTVVDRDGGVHVVLGDIRSILAPEAPYRTPSHLDGHESRPLSNDRCQQTLVGVSAIKALLRESPEPEARPLGEWLESAVMPALHGPGRHGKGPKTPDPILTRLKALTGLRAAQVARDRHSNALEKAVHRGEDAMNALTSLASEKSIDDLMAWCRGQANVPPVADSGATTTSSSEDFMNPLIVEASKASSRGTSLRPFDVIDGTSDEADFPPPKVRPAMIPLAEEPAPPAGAGKPAGRVAALADDDETRSIEARRPARARRMAQAFDEPPAPRRPAASGVDRLRELQAMSLASDRPKG